MDLAGGVEGGFLESARAKRPLQEEQSLCLGTAAGLGGAPCRGPGGLSGKHGLHGGNKASGGWPRVHSMPPQGPTPPLPWHCSRSFLSEPLYTLVRVATVHTHTEARNPEVLLASTPIQCQVCGFGLPDVLGVHYSSPRHQPRPPSRPPRGHPSGP